MDRESEVPAVSIVIPVYNRLDLTRQCLESLASTVGSFAETIVVDNASQDGTWEFLRTCTAVRRIRNTQNLGFAAACNQGAAESKSRYLVFLNNDTIALPGWLEALVETIERHSTAAIVGSRLLYPDGTIQHAGVAMSRLFRAPYHIYRGVGGNDPVVSYPREFRAVTGACMLVRRSTFESVGGFDDGFRNGFEDIDLCLKVRVRGGRILYEPRSTLYHLEGQTPGRSDHDRENLRRFHARWGAPEWSDEDLCHFQDGMRTHTAVEDGKAVLMVSPIQEETEHAGCGEVARVQAHIHLDGYERVDRVITCPEHWVADPLVLDWAEQICGTLGLDWLAERFRARAELVAGDFPMNAEPLVSFRGSVQSLYAIVGDRIASPEAPAVPLRPPNLMQSHPLSPAAERSTSTPGQEAA
jgi:GT2 family glycosyltransferase